MKIQVILNSVLIASLLLFSSNTDAQIFGKIKEKISNIGKKKEKPKEAEQTSNNSDLPPIKDYAIDYPTSFHKEHKGEILFSTQAIKTNTEISPKTSFEVSEHIHLMAYLKGTMKDITSFNNKAMLIVETNGSHLMTYHFSVVNRAANESSVYLEFLPDPNTVQHMGPEKYAEALSTISAKEHQIDITLSIGGADVARGSFKLDASKGVQPIVDKHQKYQAKNAANVFLSKSKRNDPQLEKDMVKAFNETGWKQSAVKATIFDKDWRTVTQTHTGKILYRAIRGEVTAKNPDGRCMLYFIDFMQDYQGDGKYSSHTKVHQSDGMQYMDCKNLNVVK